MFPTEVNIESLSQKASIRWKRTSLASTDRSISKSENKRLHSLIVTADPKNFLSVSTTADNSIKVPKQEELREISVELGTLKKKHDLNRGSNFLHDRNIFALKKQLDSFKQEEIKTLNRLEKLKNDVARLESSLEEVTKKQEDALAATKIYNHIIERMKINKLKLDIKNEDIYKMIKSNRKVLVEEEEILRKQKEAKIKTKKALDSLEGFVQKETKEKEENLEVIEKDVKRKQEINYKREERYRRQLEIAETAANEDREMRATQMREGVIMHKFWYLYMKKRLDFDMEKLNPIEKAFERVRKNSNVNDASEMVTKFLTTEIAFNELRRIVEDSNQNIAKTQIRIKEIEINLEKAEKMKPQSGLKEALQGEIYERIRVSIDDNEKLMRIKQIHQKIDVWSRKILKKIGKDGFKGNLLDNFKVIREYIKLAMVKVKENGNWSATKGEDNMTLKSIIDGIDAKERKKFKSESRGKLGNEIEIIRELAYSSPNPDSKLKKSMP